MDIQTHKTLSNIKVILEGLEKEIPETSTTAQKDLAKTLGMLSTLLVVYMAGPSENSSPLSRFIQKIKD